MKTTGENMGTCPDSSCHEKLKTVCEKVHGKDGLESKVSRKALVGVAVSVMGVLAIFIIYALGAAAVANDERKENRAQVKVLERTQDLEFKNLKEMLQKIEEKQVTKGDIYQIIKRVLRENGD